MEVRNQADSLAYSAEKLLREQGEQVPQDLKDEVEQAVKHVREVVDSEDISVIRAAVDRLNAALSRLGEAVYSKSGEQAPGDPGPEDGPDDIGTVEGEFREI